MYKLTEAWARDGDPPAIGMPAPKKWGFGEIGFVGRHKDHGLVNIPGAAGEAVGSDQFDPAKCLPDDVRRVTRTDDDARPLACGAGADAVQPLRYLEVCAGIGSASVAFEPLGWQCAGMAEIEPKARAFLSQRFPNTPLHHDFREITPEKAGHVDVLVGGPPCQPWSKLGKRKPNADPRRELTIEFIDLARSLEAPCFVFENVPALVEASGLSTWLRWLEKADESGYSVSWRVLDARQFGLPTRRQRLFAVGYSRRPESAYRTLFEPRRSAFPHPETAIAKQARAANRVGGFASSARSIALGQGSNALTEFLPTLCSSRPGRAAVLLDEAELRRFSIRELERGMGFPDDWTAFEWKDKPATYSMRAGLLGNAFCPPILHWIGEGIAAHSMFSPAR